jgi:hypothetical protein
MYMRLFIRNFTCECVRLQEAQEILAKWDANVDPPSGPGRPSPPRRTPAKSFRSRRRCTASRSQQAKARGHGSRTRTQSCTAPLAKTW